MTNVSVLIRCWGNSPPNDPTPGCANSAFFIKQFTFWHTGFNKCLGAIPQHQTYPREEQWPAHVWGAWGWEDQHLLLDLQRPDLLHVQGVRLSQGLWSGTSRKCISSSEGTSFFILDDVRLHKNKPNPKHIVISGSTVCDDMLQLLYKKKK